MGLAHEARYLALLQRDTDVVMIEPKPLLKAARDTERAMRDGATAIFQATFLHDGRRGHADFLIRTTRPSDVGRWSYDVSDTKLGRRLKVPALLQMAEYGEHLRRIHGVPPVLLTVIAGDGVHHRYRYADVESYHRSLSGQFDAFVENPPVTTAQPAPYCAQCRWQPQCTKGWRQIDHLSLVAFMRTDHRQALEPGGISTVAALADCPIEDLPRTIGKSSRERLAQQARLQIQERQTGKPCYELLPATPGVGLQRLPEQFQGRQAPVVIYSLASSSAEDAPRGVGFLYDIHWLNVAVSRALAMTIVVASPSLLNAPVHSPEQLRLVNALCRYVEMPDLVAAAG